MVKLEFANAFKSLHSRDMLLAVRDSLRQLHCVSKIMTQI